MAEFSQIFQQPWPLSDLLQFTLETPRRARQHQEHQLNRIHSTHRSAMLPHIQSLVRLRLLPTNIPSRWTTSSHLERSRPTSSHHQIPSFSHPLFSQSSPLEDPVALNHIQSVPSWKKPIPRPASLSPSTSRPISQYPRPAAALVRPTTSQPSTQLPMSSHVQSPQSPSSKATSSRVSTPSPATSTPHSTASQSRTVSTPHLIQLVSHVHLSQSGQCS